ncbi:7TM diverse intracellular signaling domain-containing protein [Sulfurospirillum diekertiae]|uniref:histidine kinase n=1 Tax=Sulfurospirillum diekertiae TaxID=1854492 RepID=A0A1Y0HL28_9BACT|nr:7TM diverse intracellular signaling domain-containing protein [Sulfurospirillum diekertiae]ARU48660.1 putative sensor histidine kinase pdtaS [Sulfurospirillum diekertiae]ASC93489.1 putative sensor histidine kinase pdtaS [Sulfurospirillum diekertiae]
MQQFLLWCLCIFSLSAAPIEIGQRSDVSILEHAEIYIEQDAKFKVGDVPSQDFFRPYDSNFITRGYTDDEAVWLHFSLKNDSHEVIKRFLHVNNSMLDSIVLYTSSGDVYTRGVMYLPPIGDTLDYSFLIQLNPLEEQSFYLKVLSNSCATYFNLYAESEDVLWKKNLNKQLILTFLFSIMGTLLVYNMFINFFTKERVYFMYILYIGVTLYNALSYTGMLFVVMKPFFSNKNMVAWSAIDTYLGPLYTLAIPISVLFFILDFMHIERYTKIYLSFKYLILVFVGFAFIFLFSSYDLYEWIMYYMCLISLYILAIAVYLVYKKEENSIYFLVSWGVNTTGTFLFLLYNMGIYIPLNGEYWYFYELSVVFEGLVFSIILSKRLNHTKTLASSLSTYQVLVRELHHRVKNNLQFIVSLYRLKLRKYLDADGKIMLAEAEQNVRSIGKIHEILYAHQDITALDANDYFEELIAEIKRGYPHTHIEIEINAKESLLLDQAIYCGLVVNELVTNALKYAFDEQGGTIIVSLEKEQATFILKIEDNGRGFDVNAQQSSFGISLVERLVQDELNGKVNFKSSEKGTQCLISWR